MPGPTVGFAEIRVDFDGDRLPEQARAIAQKAGAGSGFAFTEGFDKGLSAWSRKFTKRMTDAGKAGGKSFSQRLTQTIKQDLDRMGDLIAAAFVSEKGFRQFAREVGGAENAVSELNSALQRLASGGQLTQTQFKDSRASIERWANALREAELAAEAQRQAQLEAAAASKEAAEQRRVEAERLRAAQEALRKENERLAASLKDVNLALSSEKNWRVLVNDTEDAAGATERLTERIEELRAAGKLSGDQVLVMQARMRELADVTAETTTVQDNLNKRLETQTSLWKRLSFNVRQAIIITGAVAAGAEGIAGLGAAAGAGLLVLGSAITSVGIGAGVAVAAFKNLGGEIEDLPAEVRPAARAVQGLGDEFDTLQDKIQIAALKDAEGSFQSMRDTVRELTPAFESVGEALGDVIDEFADGIAPGTENFKRLQELIEDSGPIFRRVARLAGRFGEALLAIFTDPAMERSVSEFLGWLEDIADSFKEFAESPELDEFLGHARDVFGSLGGLLEATGTLLDNLVTQESIDRLTNFIDNLALFMPDLETLLQTLGELDLFGLISEVLVMFGDALEPLAGPMADLAAAINDVIEAGIEQLGPIFEAVASALAPIAQLIADAVAANPEAMATGLLAIAAAAVVLKGAQGLQGLPGLLRRTTDRLKGLGKVDFAGISAGLAGVVAVTVSGAINAAETEDPALQAQNYWTTVLSAGLLGLAGGPFGALVGAGLAAAIVAVTTHWEAISAWWEQGWSDIVNGEWATRMGEEWDTAFGEGSKWQTEWGNFFASIATWWNEGWANFPPDDSMWAHIATWWETTRTDFNTAWNEFFGTTLPTWWNEGWADTASKFENGWTQISTWWEDIRTSVNTWIEDLWSGFVTWWNEGWADTADDFSDGWAQISDWFEDILDSVTSWINNEFWDGVSDALAGFRQSWDNFWGSFTTPSLPTPSTSGFSGGGGGGMAAGGLALWPQRRLIGEAGPEAVVPLNRPLSRVDPSVRELSRIAQGGLASGGVVGGKTVIVESGAIQVVTAATDGRIVAAALLDRIVMNLPS